MDDGPQDGHRGDAPHGAGKPFDPRPYLRRIRVRGQEADYLDVKWRLAWLRTEHPDARIVTQDIQLTEAQAVFRATVEIPGGGCATGYGSETRDDFQDFIEKAETKAIGRALAALGYGTQFALDFDLEEGATTEPRAIADAPVEHPAPRQVPTRPRILPRHEDPAPAPAAPEPEPAGESTTAETPHTESPSEPPPAEEEREPYDPADYSWNDFWPWARQYGYNNRNAVANELGISVDEFTPRELRQRIIEHRRAQGLET